MSSEVPTSIKIKVKNVLSSKAGGVALSEFLSDYCNLYHETLKFRDFGFSSLQNFIKCIPDVARMITTEVGTTIIGVGEPDFYGPNSPTETQACLSKKYVKTAQVENLPNDLSINDEGLQPDKWGLWSVCLPTYHCPEEKEEELRALFNNAGEVKQMKVTGRTMFIRYAKKEEMLLALNMFSHLQVCIPVIIKRNKIQTERTK